jgi:hypothetical protein
MLFGRDDDMFDYRPECLKWTLFWHYRGFETGESLGILLTYYMVF